MLNQFSRLELILGKDNMEKLHNSRVAVFGVGGVGGYVVEALARSGIGTLDVIDNDKVTLTNINRQIIATLETIGEYKVDVIEKRCKQINENIIVNKYRTFYLPETKDEFDFTTYDYVIDCIDTVAGKISIIVEANKTNTPVISCMGTGNKLDPSKLEIVDIYETHEDPLSRVIRHELRKRNIKRLNVVYSSEKPMQVDKQLEEYCKKENKKDSDKEIRRSIPGSSAFVPPSAGLLIASKVVNDLINR